MKRKALRFLAAAGIAGAVLLPTAAVAQEYPTPSSTPTVHTDPGVVNSGTHSASTSPSGTLPFTGGDVAGLALAGLAATGVGVVLVRSGRRRRAEI